MNFSYAAYNPALQPEFETDILTEIQKNFTLIVWNDEVNSFDWVIETLIEVCGHETEQAEQCAMLIHTKGKYAVKNGDYDDLKPQCDAITERGIGATIENILSPKKTWPNFIPYKPPTSFPSCQHSALWAYPSSCSFW